MDWGLIEGNWMQFKREAKSCWSRISDEQLDVVAGRREHLAGSIEEAYGVSKEAAERQLATWQKSRKEPAPT
jgi:uncharacterized protein YjbJ (UPF0337 family)